MKSFDDLEKWIEKKDKKITVSHKKKDRELLQKTLEKLNEEHKSITEELHALDVISDTINGITKTKGDVAKQKFIDYGDYRIWVKELQKTLKKLSLKPREELTSAELEFLDREMSRLVSEKERMEKHLLETEKIIAKTSILLIDLNETYCRELSNGRSIAAIGEAIKEKFGKKLDDGYSYGRWEIIRFIENHYMLKRREAVKLFDLLKEEKTIVYNVEIPGDNLNDIEFYTPYMGEFMDEAGIINKPVYGYWMINS